MVSIGIRAKAKEIYYCIVDETDSNIELKALERFIVPQALDMPDRLSYIRTSFESIILEFGTVNAGIRIAEGIQTVNNSTIERMYIEGVIQELLSNCSVQSYFAGRKNSIASLIGTDSKTLTSCLDGKHDLLGIEGWSDRYKKEEREAIIAAVASLNMESRI